MPVLYEKVGSLRVVADGSGNPVKRIDYDSFGNIITESNPTMKIPFGFAGGLHDRDTGLVRFGFRDYDPDTGRWTAKDPIGFAGGDTDLYGYCVNDPVNRLDPSGLMDAYTMEGIGWAIAMAEPSPIGEIVMAVYTGARLADIALEARNYEWDEENEELVVCGKKGKKKTGGGLNKSQKSKPKDAPHGTKEINELFNKDDVHRIKDQIGAQPEQWTGTTSDGTVITSGYDGKTVYWDHSSKYLP